MEAQLCVCSPHSLDEARPHPPLASPSAFRLIEPPPPPVAPLREGFRTTSQRAVAAISLPVCSYAFAFFDHQRAPAQAQDGPRAFPRLRITTRPLGLQTTLIGQDAPSARDRGERWFCHVLKLTRFPCTWQLGAAFPVRRRNAKPFLLPEPRWASRHAVERGGGGNERTFTEHGRLLNSVLSRQSREFN